MRRTERDDGRGGSERAVTGGSRRARRRDGVGDRAEKLDNED